MKNVARVIFVLFFAAPLSAPALAQTAVPPPPKPAGSGPSLDVTMKYIQDKLGDIGKVSYVAFVQNVTDGSTGSNTRTFEVSTVIASTSECWVFYMLNTRIDGKPATSGAFKFSLHDVQDIVIKPMEQAISEENAREGKPNIIVTSVNPTLTALLVRQLHGAPYIFPFTDAGQADRVAKAMVHAVELCGGGGEKDPFQ
jgi:hypothetical protein